MSTDERFEIEFVSRATSYRQGVQMLVSMHARLAQTFNQASREGDRLERSMLRLAGAEQRAATGAATLGRSVNAISSASPRLRYALYDVSATATIAGAALIGLAAGTAAVSVSFERNFANVARVTELSGAGLRRLREDFDELYRTIPVGFEDLTKIGTLAGQLNIADRNIASFTETVAKFSATSNVGVEESATALGRLAQLLPDVQGDYEGLADAILKVGVNSVATEAQIIAISSQLAGVATTAGLSSRELIALAGTLASVGTAPELSRGAITRLFTNIEVAISQSGERLQDFATISGRSAEQFKRDWGSDSFQVILDLMEGIGSTGGDMGTVLRQLGIVAARDIPVFQKLAQNTDLLASAFDDAANSAGEVNRQYSIIASTTAEKINILLHNLTSLVDTLGQATLGFGLLIDAAIGVVQIFQAITDNPVLSMLAGVALAVSVLAGAMFLAIGVTTRFAASALALRLAMQELGITSAASVLSFNGLTTALFGTTVASQRATVAITALGRALKFATVAGLAIIAAEIGTKGAEGFAEWLNQVRGLRVELEQIEREGASALASAFSTDKFSFGGSRTQVDLGIIASMDPNLREENIRWLALTNNGIRATYQNLLDADAALAQWVQSGNFEAAAEGFEAIKNSEQGQLLTTEQLMSLLPQYAEALEAAPRNAAEENLELAQALLDLVDDFSSVERAALEVENSLHKLGESFGENGTALDRYSAEGRENMAALLDVIQAVAAQTPGDAATTAANLQALFDTLVQGAGVSASSLDFLRQMIAALAGQAGGQVGTATLNFNGLFTGIAAGGQKAAKAAGGAAKQVRTLIDYAKDLSQVVNRSFDIRFGSQAALDGITTSWMELNEEIAEYQRKVDALTADRAIKSYFLEVAELYGDALRAGVLRSEIADIDAELADATAGASKELTGNSKAATTNRKRITELLSSYGDYIEALAESGASQDQLNAAVAQSRSDFLAQAQALGYSDSQLVPYIAHFNDMATAIARVPRNITVAANVNPALQALNELEARIRSAKGAAGGGWSIPAPSLPDLTYAGQQLGNQFKAGFRTGANGALLYYDGTGAFRGSAGSMRFLASGGYTGNGGKYEPKGIVHGGEFVFDKRATANAGVGRLYAMMKAFRSGKGYAMGGYVPTPVPVGGGGMMGLGPDAMRVLRGIQDAIREIRPGYIFPEDVSRLSQEGDRRRRNAGEL